MVAFHFPPLAGTSGTQRTLGFARHLPAFGWEPIVLTVRPFVYERTDPSLLSDELASFRIHRAWAWDSARHFSVANKYPAILARPDRWVSWWPGAVIKGARLVRECQPSAVWSTYPIATAHLIARTLHRRTRLPWIADFRDPMAQDGYPADPGIWRSFKRIEERTIAEADHSVFTTRGAAQMYRERYPLRSAAITVIENGFDEDAFSGLAPPVNGARRSRRLLLHSGIVYPSERDPSNLFAALRVLRDAGRLTTDELLIRFRAPTHDALLRELSSNFGVADFI
jgi:hypothetical protein